MNILLICTGNTCRSPMAEALLKDKLPQANVQSAGIFAVNNQLINDHARDVLNKKGIAFTHQSQPVTERLLDWAHLVLTMTTEHKRSLILHYPGFQEKYFTLKEYVSEADKMVWDKLKEKYANYEERRLLLVKENEYKSDSVNDDLKEDLKEIRQLERSLSNYDISDPFGGSIEVYERTLAELDKYINLLIDKIK